MVVKPSTQLKRIFSTLGELQEYVTNPANYKPCRMKSYSMWACMLHRERERLVTNCYFRDKDIYSTTSRINAENPIVLSGIGGVKELTAINPTAFCLRFTLMDGKPITPEYLQSRKNKIGEIPWTQVKYKPTDTPYCAVCIPSKYSCELKVGGCAYSLNLRMWNANYISRAAIGDFIVCPMHHGTPNLSQAFVVQGDLFLALFDNHGWSNCILSKNNLPKSTPKPPTTAVDSSGYVFVLGE